MIVLIVTIIVIIVLAAVVILTITKNNPIENAKEARFKEDVRSFQDDLAMTVSKQYTDLQGQRDWKINTSDFKEMTEYILSFTEKYKDKFIIWNDILVANKDLSSIEKKWAEDLGIYVIDYFIWDDDATTIIGINYEFLQGVTVLKIPSNCTAIRSDFVANNSNVEYRDFVAGITKVEIPDTVTTIGSYAFHNFKQLESINTK